MENSKPKEENLWNIFQNLSWKKKSILESKIITDCNILTLSIFENQELRYRNKRYIPLQELDFTIETDTPQEKNYSRFLSKWNPQFTLKIRTLTLSFKDKKKNKAVDKIIK